MTTSPTTKTKTKKTYGIVEALRSTARARLRRALRLSSARAYNPPPKMSLSEWADTYRRLSKEASPIGGRWDTDNEPMARGVMNSISDSLVEKVSVMCASQIMKTEALLNTVGYYVHNDPAPILIVQPNIDLCKSFSKDRLTPMFRDTPVLRHLFNPAAKDSEDNILHKAFPGGRINIVGANAPRGLASRPIRVVLMDEIDGFPASAGKEGDPVGLAEKRTTRFWDRKVILVSTPTVKGTSRIEQSFLEGDQRRFYVDCPHCEFRQTFKWAQVKWPEDHPEDAAYFCEDCGCEWSEVERHEAIHKAGQRPDWGWVATAPFKGHASFHASQLASKNVPLARIVREFLEAKGSFERVKQWTNTVLAETFEVGGERADPDSLFQRREDYSHDPLPAEVGIITAGVDIQGNRAEVEIVGWGAFNESYSLQYEVINGDPTSPTFWENLDEVLLREYNHPSGIRLKIDTTCVDSGYETTRVYDFCRPRAARRVFAIKGPSNSVNRPIWPKTPTRNTAKQTDVYLLGLDNAKMVMQRLLMQKERGPGFCHFPKTERYDENYFNGLTIEKCVTRYKFGRPFREWHTPDGGRNEPWDCRIYAYAARVSSPVNVERRLADLNSAVTKNAASLNPTPGPPAMAAAGRRMRSSGVSA